MLASVLRVLASSARARDPRPITAAIAAVVSLSCSAGDEDSSGSLSAGPYMPGATATGEAESSGTQGDAAPDDDDGQSDPTGDGAATSSGEATEDTAGSTEDGSTGADGDASTGDAPPTMSCGELAADQGFVVGACESNGNGACGGVGTPTIDCDFCCDICPAGDTCGALAMASGWAAAACETPGNPACGGVGTPTCDCTVCCEQ